MSESATPPPVPTLANQIWADRRKPDTGSDNRQVIGGIVWINVATLVGTFALVAMNRPLIDWAKDITLVSVGGLLTFLQARAHPSAPAPHPPGVNLPPPVRVKD